MKKLFALATATLLILIFASSCSGKDSFYTVDGVSCEVVRNSDGNFVTDSAGNLCVYLLNENNRRTRSALGEDLTSYIPFDGKLVKGQSVETASMKFTLPAGFNSSDTDFDAYFSEDQEKKIYISDITETTIDEGINSDVSNCERLLELYGGNQFSYGKNVIHLLNGLTVTKVWHKCTSEEYLTYLSNYYVSYGGGYFRFECSCAPQNADKTDFDRFIRSLELK